MCATSVDNGVWDWRFAKYDFDGSELSLNKLISLFRTGMYAPLEFQVFRVQWAYFHQTISYFTITPGCRVTLLLFAKVRSEI